MHLNGNVIRTRRLELKLSQRALSDRIGASTNLLSRIERGHDVRDVTLQQLQRLANELQLRPAEMFDDALASGGDRFDRDPTDDDVMIEAALAEAGRQPTAAELATALRWNLKRVHEALQALEQRLTGTGLELHRAGNGKLDLRPRPGVLDNGATQRLVQTQRRDRSLTLSEARVLRSVQKGDADEKWERTLSNPNARPSPG